MKKLFLTIALLSLSTFNASAFASSGGDHLHSEKKEKPKCTAEHAALGHCTMEEGDHSSNDAAKDSSKNKKAN
ncbi:MAG: hypothetical protein ACRBEE_07935 [Arenicella sp.]